MFLFWGRGTPKKGAGNLGINHEEHEVGGWFDRINRMGAFFWRGRHSSQRQVSPPDLNDAVESAVPSGP